MRKVRGGNALGKETTTPSRRGKKEGQNSTPSMIGGLDVFHPMRKKGSQRHCADKEKGCSESSEKVPIALRERKGPRSS